MKNIFRITTSAYNDIIATIGSQTAETGGMLFGSRKDFVVTKFVFDKHAHTTATSYSINTEYINPIIKSLWEEENLESLGFIHSHPYGYGQLSPPDKAYLQSQFRIIPVDKFLAPIIFSAKDGAYQFHPFIYHKNGTVETATLEIVPDDFLKQKKINEVNQIPQIELINTIQEENNVIQKDQPLHEKNNHSQHDNSKDTSPKDIVFFEQPIQYCLENLEYVPPVLKKVLVVFPVLLLGIFCLLLLALLGLFLSLLPQFHQFFTNLLTLILS